jgi:hypothetical protein
MTTPGSQPSPRAPIDVLAAKRGGYTPVYLYSVYFKFSLTASQKPETSLEECLGNLGTSGLGNPSDSDGHGNHSSNGRPVG